jgi:ankyrin repeat protein
MRGSELSAAIEFFCRIRSFTTFKELEDHVDLDVLGTDGISALIGPLIKTTADVDGIMSIVHSSAKEYLIDLAPDKPQSPSSPRHAWVWNSLGILDGGEGAKLSTRAAEVMSLQCQDLIFFAARTGILTSLAEPATELDHPAIGSLRSLVKYAVENLPDHIRQCPPKQDTRALFASFVANPTGRIWMSLFWMLKDPSQKYRDFSPLQFCCALGLVEAVRHLLPKCRYPTEYLQDIQAVMSAQALASELLTAVDIAAMFGNVGVLELLCEGHGTPVDSDNLIPETTYKTTPSESLVHIPLMSSRAPAPGTDPEEVINEREKAVEQLTWYRPLHTATRYGQADAVEYLISRGSALFRQDEDGKCAFELAVDKNVEVIIPILLHHHMDSMSTLLLRFIHGGHLRYVAWLAELRPDLLVDGVEFQSRFGESRGSIAHLAAATGSETIFDFLVEVGGRSDIKDSEGRQGIHYAASAGRTAFVEHMLAQDTASRHLTDRFDRNPLYYASIGSSCADDSCTPSHARERVITALIGQVPESISTALVSSAIISLLTDSSTTTTSCSPRWDIEKAILTLPWKISRNQLGAGFLHKAFTSASFPLRVALDLNSNANETDSRGQTLLHAAAATERIWDECHRELAGRMSDINCRDAQGMTPLHAVVEAAEIAKGGILNRIILLADLGADMNSADSLGKIPATAVVTQLLTASPLDPQSGSAQDHVLPDGVLVVVLSNEGGSAQAIRDDVLPQLVTSLVNTRRNKDAVGLLKVLSPR